jgi:hypothetical protein
MAGRKDIGVQGNLQGQICQARWGGPMARARLSVSTRACGEGRLQGAAKPGQVSFRMKNLNRSSKEILRQISFQL